MYNQTNGHIWKMENTVCESVLFFYHVVLGIELDLDSQVQSCVVCFILRSVCGTRFYFYHARCKKSHFPTK